MDLLRYRNKAFGALAVKSLPLLYGAAVILFVNTHLPRDTELGVYTLAIATFFVVSLMGKSFALYPLIKFLAEGRADRGIWKAGIYYWIGTQLIGAAVVWIIAPYTSIWFHAEGMADGMRWACWIILVFIPRDLASALLVSRREVGRLFWLEACYFLVAAGGIVGFALAGILHNADQVLGLNLAAGALSTAAAPLLCLGRIPKAETVGKQHWGTMARFGRDSLGIGIGDTVYTQLDYHLLGLFMGAGEVALYFAAKNFFRFYNAVTQAINLLIFPTSSNLYARGEIDKLKELLEKILGSYLGLLLLVNTILLFAADGIVALVYRGIFPDAANVLRIFILASFFEPLYMVSENVLYGIGKPKAILIAMWSSIPIFLLLAWLLMPRLGALGGALSVAGTLVSLASMTMYFIHKEIRVTPLSIVQRLVTVIPQLWARRR